MKKNQMRLLISFIFVFLVLVQAVYVVPEGHEAIILQLGEPVGSVRLPGLHFRIPFVQKIVYLDTRIQTFTIDDFSSFTSDIKSFDINNYVCWQITDPRLFISTLRNEDAATERLRTIVYSQLRAVVGNKTLGEIVSGSRGEVMQEVLTESAKQAKSYGVDIIDVRIKRADLPNRQAIFARMNAERLRMANEYRYSGEARAKEIRSQAELDRDTLLAAAEKESLSIRGAADARAMQIIRESVSAFPEFYAFMRSLDIYKQSFSKKTKVILSSDDPLLQEFDR